MTAPAAIVFDFDGTIVDTETPTYTAWQETFFGYLAMPISFEQWVTSIGLSGRQFDPVSLLQEQLGVPVDREAVLAARLKRRNEMLALLPLRAGVQSVIDAAVAGGVRLGVASSSSRDWVESNLKNRELRPHFSVVCCAGDPLDDGTMVPGKPDPTSYRLACAGLGAAPEASVAIEDSPHGVTAANEAGMMSVAVPGPMTAHFDFSHADVVVESLDDLDLGAYPWGVTRR